MAEQVYAFEIERVVHQRRAVAVKADGLERAFEKGISGDILETSSSGWKDLKSLEPYVSRPFEVASESDADVYPADTDESPEGPVPDGPLSVTCPKCGALVGKDCVTPSGATANTHAKRVQHYKSIQKLAEQLV